MFLIFPATVAAAAILALMSVDWSPSARKMDPRYLEVQTFSISSPSHTTCGSASWAAFRIAFLVSLSAVEPRHARLECVRVMCALSVLAVL